MSPSKLRLKLWLSVALAVTVSAGYARTQDESHSCKVLPGDPDWPRPQDWESLNKTLGGGLIASLPPGSVCHDEPFNNYDADACAELQTAWERPSLSHMANPAEILSMYFKNYTCDPFTPRSQPCDLGNYVSYVVDVAGADDIKATLEFATKHNVRIVIKNTGHDYLGRSTGKGGLSLWTHNLKSTEFIPKYESSHYSGPAMKLGAGVQGFEAYAAADAVGHRIVGGACPTVGIAGGYSQGGGHSLLSSSHGMASDNVLEWEVITAKGQHLVATPEQHSDLYWALTGGGPGNYAVVLSMIARVHPDTTISGGSLVFDDSKVGSDAFWEAVGAFHALLPDFSDAGNSFTYGMTADTFIAWVITMPDTDLEQSNAYLKPFLDDLKSRGIDYQYTPHYSKGFYDHYSWSLGPLPEGLFHYATFTNSRMVTRDLLSNPHSNARVMAALRNISTAPGYVTACQSLSVGDKVHPLNAVLPTWRDTLSFCVPSGSWDPHASPADMAARQDLAVNYVQATLDAATPGGGTYMNEVNYMQPNWKEVMYGSNYERLFQIKHKYDPDSLLYVKNGVGSDAWVEDSDKRLCRNTICGELDYQSDPFFDTVFTTFE
ncbi:FAD-binding domain-containing protein [Penicillium robsamsonii]|uniref:FAD-binding domain-containing protein n=1 Tax=Penicillium robsamsonii TaxID=1792511 RepID=UPI002546E6DD|nr:FAD-binding domain-containing protein [Penicillium robsamsonii]KAJ5817288.1 FAD-binding domain-containing protein [Penicillium robsamsonii]